MKGKRLENVAGDIIYTRRKESEQAIEPPTFVTANCHKKRACI
jgi:hypothetical protein